MSHHPPFAVLKAILLPTLLLLSMGPAEAKNPAVSSWWRNLSSSPVLEADGKVWRDEFGDLQVVGKAVHTLWYGLREDWGDERFVYRRSIDEGATWKPAIVIAANSNYPGSDLIQDESAKYLCVSGQNVHIVVPRSFPISATRSWYYNLYYYRSTDGGATFEAERPLVAGADVWHITQPRIACNTQRVVIGYKYRANWYDNYQIPLLISDDAGESFRQATATATNDYSGNFEDLLLYGTDIYVLHYRLLENYYYGNFQARIGLSSSSDDGAHFVERWLTTAATDGRYYALGTKDYYNSPDLAVFGSTVSVIWTQLNTNYMGTKTLMYRRSTDKGKTFGSARVIYRANELSPGQETITSKGKYVYVVFPTTDGKTRLRRSTDGGASFQALQILSNEGGWWPQVRTAPEDPTGATVYFFRDSPSYRRSTNGGATSQKILWLYPAFTTGNYQRSQRFLSAGGKIHSLTSGQLWSADLCDGYCDRDMLYRRELPASATSTPGYGLRLYTESETFQDRADNMQALSKTLDSKGDLTVELWVKDLGGGITTGYTDAHSPILFKQRDLTTSYRPAFSIGTQDSYGKRRINGEVETTTGYHRIIALDDPGLLPATAWTHLALTYQPGATTDNLRLFKNGVLIAKETVTGDLVPGFGNLFVGRYGNWLVDELRIWGRVLGATELNAKSKGPLTGSETGLRAYYNFDKTTRDITGHGNDGVLMYKEAFLTGKY